MKFISIDIENNQPSGEIIQIGAIEYDTNNVSHTNEFNVYIKWPNPINWNYELRGNGTITLGELLPYGQETIDAYGKDPRIAFTEFWQWVETVGSGRKFVQWGKYDMAEIMKQTKELIVEHPRVKTFNLKTAYQFLYQPSHRLSAKYGLEQAVTNSQLTFKGTPHDALVDARNTGELMLKMYNAYSKLYQITEVLKK